MKSATPIINGKMWIVNGTASNFATITLSDNRYLYSEKNNSRFFDNLYQLQETLDIQFSDEIGVSENKTNDIRGFPTNCFPENIVYDLRKKLYIYTKTSTSSSWYCAGHFLIKFEKRWGRAFCPKLVTLDKYEYRGPFKTKKEALKELNNEKLGTN